MPIVNGKYECKISSHYDVEKGISEIKNAVAKTRKVRISQIPMNLLEEILPLLKDKDLKIILPLGTKIDKEKAEELKELCEIAITKAKIYTEYKGKEMNIGNITLPNVIFNIVWQGNEIFAIDTLEYSKCVKCMKDTFETGWRYAEKMK